MMFRRILLIILFVFSVNSSSQVSDFDTIDFSRADNIAKLNEGASLDNLPFLATKLTSKLSTDVEKFRAIHTWVCQNIKADLNQHNSVSNHRQKLGYHSTEYLNWNNEYKKKAFKRLLRHKKTMCTGYSYLIKELCFLANIDCKVINGYARTVDANIGQLEDVNHSWNAVKLSGKWYLCDATWSSGYTYGSTFVKAYNDGYFLAEPLLFGKNHHPIEKQWFLNDSLKNKTFEVEPIVYGETFKHNILPIEPKELDIHIKKNTTVSFKFKSYEKNISYDDIALVHYNKKHEKKLKIYNFQSVNGNISFKHQFEHNGLLDVHLKIHDDIVATYTILTSE